MKNILVTTLKILTSKILRPILIGGGFFLLLLFLVDSFIMPWYVNRSGTQKIPNVVGMKKEQAMKLLDSLNLQPKEGEIRTDNSYPEGFVVSQNPIAEQIVKSGRRVYLTISGGEQPVVAPSLRGRSIRDAKFTLDRVGLRQGAILYEVSRDFPEGTIIKQDIAAGTKVKRNTYISIIVSAGESIDSIIVPSVIGNTLADAQRIIKSKGLQVGNITYQVQPDLLPNTVIDQFPRESQIVTVEKTVDLFIVQAPEKTKQLREN